MKIVLPIKILKENEVLPNNGIYYSPMTDKYYFISSGTNSEFTGPALEDLGMVPFNPIKDTGNPISNVELINLVGVTRNHALQDLAEKLLEKRINDRLA